MKLWLLVSSLALFALTVGVACTNFMAHTTQPLVRELPWDEAPASAYTRALLIAQRTTGDYPRQVAPGIFRITVHQAVELTVAVVPMPQGHPQAHGAPTLVTVAGLILPNRIALGDFTEVDEFLHLFVASRPRG